MFNRPISPQAIVIGGGAGLALSLLHAREIGRGLQATYGDVEGIWGVAMRTLELDTIPMLGVLFALLILAGMAVGAGYALFGLTRNIWSKLTR